MPDMVAACPECDNSSFKRRVPNDPASAGAGTEQYRCGNCGAVFDDPVERPRKIGAGSETYGLSGASKRLAEADTDDLVTDGGRDTLAYITVANENLTWYEVYPADAEDAEYRLECVDHLPADRLLTHADLETRLEDGWEIVYEGVREAPEDREEPELITDGGRDYEIGDASRRAADVVSQERDSHGDAYTNHRQIAALWSAFLDDQLDDAIEPWQAAIMMQQVKQSRMQAGELIADHFVDIAGYSDVGLYAAVRDPDVEVDTDDI